MSRHAMLVLAFFGMACSDVDLDGVRFACVDDRDCADDICRNGVCVARIAGHTKSVCTIELASGTVLADLKDHALTLTMDGVTVPFPLPDDFEPAAVSATTKPISDCCTNRCCSLIEGEAP